MVMHNWGQVEVQQDTTFCKIQGQIMRMNNNVPSDSGNHRKEAVLRGRGGVDYDQNMFHLPRRQLGL